MLSFVVQSERSYLLPALVQPGGVGLLHRLWRKTAGRVLGEPPPCHSRDKTIVINIPPLFGIGQQSKPRVGGVSGKVAARPARLRDWRLKEYKRHVPGYMELAIGAGNLLVRGIRYHRLHGCNTQWDRCNVSELGSEKRRNDGFLHNPTAFSPTHLCSGRGVIPRDVHDGLGHVFSAVNHADEVRRRQGGAVVRAETVGSCEDDVRVNERAATDQLLGHVVVTASDSYQVREVV